MKQVPALVVAGALIAGAPAAAEVADSASNGFTVVHEAVVDAAKIEAWEAAVGQVGQWWSSDHTIGGDAARLRIDVRPMGCFCEDLKVGAGVVHMTVTMVNPGVILRLTGGLGPLGLMGVDGNMTWEFEEEEVGTRIRFTYVVGGYRPGGLGELAGPVDFVIGEALERLRKFIATGDPEPLSLD